MDYKSTVSSMGSTVDQIIHFSGSPGNKRTFRGIDTKTIQQGEFTKMKLRDGRMLLINTNNVDCVEVFTQQEKMFLDCSE